MSDKRIERTAVGTPSDYAEIEAMSRAELIALILATIESGELDSGFRRVGVAGSRDT
jgi:hypothetical protein